MEDKETISILTSMLDNDTRSLLEKDAIRDAIGILSWTMLVEGMKAGKKRRRDAQLNDEHADSFT